MLQRSILAVLLILFANLAAAATKPMPEATRGELLYSTHCTACHTRQIHWREKKLAKDWMGIHSQVNRWQGVSGLRWSEDDIDQVTRYLNTLYYHYPTPD